MQKTKSGDFLGDRMKRYEALSTSRQLMPGTPVYARIDGRAFHTMCRGLRKPYSRAFMYAMGETCRFLVDKTGAKLGYVQSDEISLGWEDCSKAPFEGRIQKLESVLASMAAAKFALVVETANPLNASYDGSDMEVLKERVERFVPSFDCRVFNVPDMSELANSFLWRENDAIKNSITGMALSFFSHKQLQNVSGDMKVTMMKAEGYDFYRETPPAFMRGSFYRRETYWKEISKEDYNRASLKWGYGVSVNDDGGGEKYYCQRSRVGEMFLPYRLSETQCVDRVLFNEDNPMPKTNTPTFVLDKELHG